MSDVQAMGQHSHTNKFIEKIIKGTVEKQQPRGAAGSIVLNLL